MGFDLLALYAGPDQVMTVTSGLASIIGVVLIFWNKLVAAFLKFVHLFGRSAQRANPAPQRSTPADPS
jgi:undecaprenyl pyrophosphate phosphatase UppP